MVKQISTNFVRRSVSDQVLDKSIRYCDIDCDGSETEYNSVNFCADCLHYVLEQMKEISK